MDAYLKIVHGLAAKFDFFELVKVPRGENVCADALAALGSKLHDQVKRTIPIHRIEKPSINISTDQTAIIAPVTETDTLVTDEFGPDMRTESTEKWAARRLKTRSAHYVVLDNELHRWTVSKVLLKCIHGEEAVRVVVETHEGAGGNHSGGRALAIKVRSLGFFWPTMNADCESYARSCDKCQRHAPSIHCPTEMLRTTVAPYPFMRWAMDIIGPRRNGQGYGRNTGRRWRKPFGRTRISNQSEKPGLFLADDERRLRVLRQKLRQVPTTCTKHPLSN
ncbi:PREDICTED: uncharacterized protein LOC106321528 [Brassica oleracea var. oleracea]|uniref:uncharacterized protein LOC106321528 n=1 Tax=Brassica oleracea var. oleracea TaxID=109376 RepID=UPI0006A6E336|nr:PREDICTED: uncharacterized protein LOC106321528 [Brassica oleracea var. oleracea]